MTFAWLDRLKTLVADPFTPREPVVFPRVRPEVSHLPTMDGAPSEAMYAVTRAFLVQANALRALAMRVAAIQHVCCPIDLDPIGKYDCIHRQARRILGIVK